MKFLSETQNISKYFMNQTKDILKEYGEQVASLEREKCAMILEQLRDGTEDQVQKDLYNDAVTAIRRSPCVRL